MNLSPLTDALLGAAAASVTLLASLLVPLLPRLFVWLRVRINGADAELVRRAIENAATNALAPVHGGQPMQRAIDDMVAYVRASLPGALGRLRVSDETLDAMCRAALARALG